MATKAEAIGILERLRDAYHPHPELKARTISIYADMLVEFDAEVLVAASLAIPKRSKWWPSIAEIRETCVELSRERVQLPTTGEAYAEARRMASSVGAYTKPVAEDFSHAIVHRAALQAAGSWRRWCLADDEAPLRARFFECYRELRDRELRRQSLPESMRALTTEESRQALEDVHARAARERRQLGPGDAKERKPTRERAKRSAAKRAVVVGERLSDEEFERRKAELLEAARAEA